MIAIDGNLNPLSGQDIILTCQYISKYTSSNSTVVKWLKSVPNGDSITISSSFHFNISTLAIRGASPADAGNYTCMVTNPGGHSNNLSVSVDVHCKSILSYI